MPRLSGLEVWLAENAGLSLSALHDAFSRMLYSRGLPLWRVVLGTETLHPEEMGGQSVWIVDETASLSAFYHGVETTSAYLDSPLKIVDDTGEPFRRNIEGEAADMPLLRELQSAGATDYFMHPLPFLDRGRSAFLSFATTASGGFTDADIGDLALATRLFSPYAERHVLRRIAVDLLDTYLGHHAGERIFSGQIKRGQVESIEAAIMMCDMRGFTAYSNRHGRQAVIDTVNMWFEALAGAIEEQGGEILKFMGDGLLAIFRADADSGEACRRAVEAAGQAETAVAMLETQGGDPWQRGGEARIAFVTALHVGAVAYGNVGGRRRLDFTVLGPAVNYASRLESLAKELGRPIVASADFAAALDRPLVPLGAFPLRNFGDAEEVFALPDGA